MSEDELCNLGVLDLSRLYRLGKVSPVELVNAHLRRCGRLNPVLNAFLLVLEDSALEAAKGAESLFRAGVDLGLLQGVPVSIKDLIHIRGTRTTAGSRVLIDEATDQTDAGIVRILRSAGAIIIGKTNLHEFASGDPEPDGPFGLVQNPRRIGYHPGSSSSGAGAASATCLGVIAIGTDTGGSVRIPACLCGVAGLKPTTGWLALDEIIPLSSTLDTVGSLARRVSDIAAVMLACNKSLGHFEDLGESEEMLRKKLSKPVQGWRLGFPSGGFFRKTQPAVEKAFQSTIQALHDLGCQLIDYDCPEVDSIPDLVTTIIQAEGAYYHRRYTDKEHLYGPSFRERILSGREIKATAYLEALRRQEEIRKKWSQGLEKLDAIITPTIPALAPRHGVQMVEIDGEQFPFRPLLGRFTRPFNLLGWPALTIPNGFGPNGLPTGVQIAGKPGSEFSLLTLGYALETALGMVEKLGMDPLMGDVVENYHL